jgi:acetoin utilization deacetylase AcuC-like enzyme
MLVAHSPLHGAHDPGHEVQNGLITPVNDVPARVDAVLDAVAADGGFTVVEATEYGLGPIQAVHDAGLVEFLASAWEDWAAEAPDVSDAIPEVFSMAAARAGMGPGRLPRSVFGRIGVYAFDTSTPLVAGTYAAARAAVDTALTATAAVLGGARHAYGLCRPPGHHAAHAVYGGFCFFNNAAVAAQHARDAGAAKVAVLDVDYHHGNGTQQLFYDRPDVLFVSLHADPDRAYPHFAGFEEETGAGPGLGTTRNLVLPADLDDDGFVARLGDALDSVAAFAPDLLVVSLGVDTYHLDPFSDLAVTGRGFARCGQAVASLGVPTVVLQEGGYHLRDLGGNVVAWLRGLAGTA